MKDASKSIEYRRVLKVVILLAVAILCLVISSFFVLRANSFRLLLTQCGVPNEEIASVTTLYHGFAEDKETYIILAGLDDDSKLMNPEVDWLQQNDMVARCEKTQWGFWKLRDYKLFPSTGYADYKWKVSAGYESLLAYPFVGEEMFEYHELYYNNSFWHETLEDEPIRFLSGQVPENVSTSVVATEYGTLIHVAYVAKEPIDFPVMSIMEENGMIVRKDDFWLELDESLFVEDVDSLTEEERQTIISGLYEAFYMSGRLKPEDLTRVTQEMQRLGVEFLTDEEVKDQFPGVFYSMQLEQLKATQPVRVALMSLIVAIPLIVIAIPFVIGPLAAKHRRKKEARQAENAQDI